MGEPAFDGLIFFERATKQSGEALVLKHGSATFIKHEDATWDTFEIAAQACFAPGKDLLCFREGAQFLVCV